VKIQILSDLHNEFLRGRAPNPLFKWKGRIESVDADVIILAGDIDVGTKGIEWAVQESERLETPIIYVPGNHEYYHHDIHDLKNELINIAKDTNVFLFNPGVAIFDDVRFIGATLWTDYKSYADLPQSFNMNQLSNSLRDHSIISIKEDGVNRFFMPGDALLLHAQELDWIITELKKPIEGKTIVVTHHGPHNICQHKSYPLSPISTGFHSDLSHVICNNPIDAWIYGHTHSNLDAQISNTRIISNQAGYPNENVQDFDPGYFIEI